MAFHFTCERCAKPFERHNSRPARFCSHACKAAFHGTGHMVATAEERASRAAERRGTGRGDGYVKRGGRHEHRVVAEQMLGRPLAPGEIVAHKDRRKPNNDASNLEVYPTRADFARAMMINRRRPCA